MIESNDLGIDENTPHKINRETSKMHWNELLPFFAKGMTIYVSHKVDLIKVATILSNDDKCQFEKWLKKGLVANVSDEQASVWYEEKILVWAVVIKPWVLVQPIVD
ncbi:MAG: hypothetical protein CMF45_07030 [Legionellales bacterium]|nr:hypothetical protein [Legionellales bacterium]|tara:strand:- start:172 stop:489 length:318 start_codon:yes stop_codon:yes gene_type:complete